MKKIGRKCFASDLFCLFNFHTKGYKIRMCSDIIPRYLEGGAPASGFLSTRMTESPRRNILDMKRSLLTGLLWDCKRIMLKWRILQSKFNIKLRIVPSSCLSLIEGFQSTFLWHFPRPYYSDGRKLWHVQGASCYYGSWSEPECCSSLTALTLKVVPCWTPLLPVWPTPLVSFLTLVCLLQHYKQNIKITLKLCYMQILVLKFTAI